DSDSDPAVARRPVSPRRHGSREKIVAPASRRHLSLDNSFWVNTTFAGWKPAIHFFSRPRSARRFHRGIRFSVPLRVLRENRWSRRSPSIFSQLLTSYG